MGEAVRSALGQVTSPMEIIISDDCSSDDTYIIIKKLIDAYSGPHKVILNRNEKNLGLAGNLNKAHYLSSGELIVVAAGDDISYSYRTQSLLDVYVAKRPVLLCSYADVIDTEGRPMVISFKGPLFYKKWTIESVARSKSLYLGATGAWHRSLFFDFGPLDDGAYEDLVFGFRAALLGRVEVIKKPLIQYMFGSGITSPEDLDGGILKFQQRRKFELSVLAVIMGQRIRDARKFGWKEKSKVMRILFFEKKKAEIRRDFYIIGFYNSFIKSISHPLIGLSALISEKRRCKKIENRLKERQMSKKYG
ncbi:MAG: glycosyltransferase [Rhodobacteraceae bacterium]|nr:glycosyltransferase [Paracoccaceae bacterium]